MGPFAFRWSTVVYKHKSANLDMNTIRMKEQFSFLRRVDGLSLSDTVRSSVIRERFRVEPVLLHTQTSQLRLSPRGHSVSAGHATWTQNTLKRLHQSTDLGKAQDFLG